MAKKSALITFKTTPEFKEKLERIAHERGFSGEGKRPNKSSLIRWILEKSHSALPLCREKYQQLFEVNQNLIRLGSLFNQTIYNINKERFILNDKGFYDENNEVLLKSLEALEHHYDSLKKEIDEIKKITQKIVNIEGA